MTATPGDRPDHDATAAGRQGTAPAADLADVWVLLDELPRGTASAVMTATTLEMAAVDAAGLAGRGTRAAGRFSWVRWLGPVAAVAAALVAGVVAGRIASTDADERLFEELPLIMHLDLLREAGSERFLEELAVRTAKAPLRLALRSGPENARKKTEAYLEEIKSLTRMLATSDSVASLRDRRKLVAALPLEERIELEKSARAFIKLSANERRGLAAVAAAVVDPKRPQLRAAALVWHQWLAGVRPEEREGIVASGTDKRIEWVEWYSQRPEPRGPGGPGGPGGPPPGGWDRRDWDRRLRPGFQGGPEPPPGGEHRGPGMRPRGDEPPPGPPPFSPERRPPPPETQAPPR